MFNTKSAVSGLCSLLDFSPPFLLNKLAVNGYFLCLPDALRRAKGSWKYCSYHDCLIFASLLPLLAFIVTQSNKQKRRIKRKKPSYILMWIQCASWPWLVYKIDSVSCWLGGMIFNILFYKFVVYSNFIFLLSLMITRESTLESSASSLWRSHLNMFATVRNGLRLCYFTRKRRGGKTPLPTKKT